MTPKTINEIYAQNVTTAVERYGLAKMQADGVILSQIQFILEELLPGIERRYGSRDHRQYVAFEEIVQSLLFCLELKATQEKILFDLARAKDFQGYWRQRADELEKQLLRYTTVEAMLLDGSLDEITRVVREKRVMEARELLDNWKRRQSG